MTVHDVVAVKCAYDVVAVINYELSMSQLQEGFLHYMKFSDNADY